MKSLPQMPSIGLTSFHIPSNLTPTYRAFNETSITRHWGKVPSRTDRDQNNKMRQGLGGEERNPGEMEAMQGAEKNRNITKTTNSFRYYPWRDRRKYCIPEIRTRDPKKNYYGSLSPWKLQM